LRREEVDDSPIIKTGILSKRPLKSEGKWKMRRVVLRASSVEWYLPKEAVRKPKGALMLTERSEVDGGASLLSAMLGSDQTILREGKEQPAWHIRVGDGEGATLLLRAGDATEWGVWRAALVGVVAALKEASAGAGFKPKLTEKSYSRPHSMGRTSYDADRGGDDDDGGAGEDDGEDKEALRREATRREAQIAKMQARMDAVLAGGKKTGAAPPVPTAAEKEAGQPVLAAGAAQASGLRGARGAGEGALGVPDHTLGRPHDMTNFFDFGPTLGKGEFACFHVLPLDIV
jgi:hypothetical protein